MNYNKSILEDNAKNNISRVNINGFGQGVVYKNLTTEKIILD